MPVLSGSSFYLNLIGPNRVGLIQIHIASKLGRPAHTEWRCCSGRNPITLSLAPSAIFQSDLIGGKGGELVWPYEASRGPTRSVVGENPLFPQWNLTGKSCTMPDDSVIGKRWD